MADRRRDLCREPERLTGDVRDRDRIEWTHEAPIPGWRRTLSREEQLLTLQRSAGNHAVASLLARQAAPGHDGGMSEGTPRVDPAGQRHSFDIPVTLVATPAGETGNDSSSLVCREPTSTPGGGLGGAGFSVANMAAHGEHAWGGASRLGTWQYWSPMVPGTGPRNGIVVERALNEIPRDLAPRIMSEIRARSAGGAPLSWSDGHMSWANYTEADLMRVPELVRQVNANPSALAQAELDMLASMANVHINGSTPGTPFASYATPGADVSSVGSKLWRVQVEIDPSTALNVSDRTTPVSQLLAVENASEREVMVVTDDAMRILSVESTSGTVGVAAQSSGARSFAMRNAGAIRWGGRAVLVVSIAYSGYRVATADEHERGRVIGEEAGGQLLGWGGAVAGGALCIGFSIATAGVGLLACGLVGGLIGGIGGSYLGGAIGGSFDEPRSSGAGATPSGPMCPVVPEGAAAPADDPFGLSLGGPSQTATLLDFLAAPGVQGQLQPPDYGVIRGWAAAH